MCSTGWQSDRHLYGLQCDERLRLPQCLVSAVPEPRSWLLLVVGMLGLVPRDTERARRERMDAQCAQ